MFNTSMRETIINLTKNRSTSLAVVSVGLCAAVMANIYDNDEVALVDVANETHSYIVKANNYQQLQFEIDQMSVTPTHELDIIKSLAVDLTTQQLQNLEQKLDITVSNNHKVELNAVGPGQRKWQPAATTPDFINAGITHYNGNYGGGVTMAFLDTGLTNLNGLGNDRYGYDKYWGTYNAVTDTASNSDWEANGHGTHVSSVAGNSDFDSSGRIYGIAPDAKMLGIKAFDSQGKATYADVIRGIGWVVTHKSTYNIRVMNMSFSGPVQSYYWEDPLNQAVTAAWQAGIVIVASAGNKGPDPMTIGVPGNNPYVITVGAMTDNYTPFDSTDDKMAIFSASGPTVEGFVKPEIIAPGGHMSGLMTTDSYLVTEHPEFHDGGRYFEMSGTSQSAAVVTGVVALMLTADPTLTPDDVKCRLIASARPATNPDNSRAYSVFQQGAGAVNAADAIASQESNCANQGLDIAADLAGTKHFAGPVGINTSGDFFVENTGDDYVWDIPTDMDGTQGLLWKGDIESSGGFIWGTNYSFNTDGGFIWGTAYDYSADPARQTSFETNSEFLWKTVGTDGGFIWGTSINIASDNIGVNSWVDAY